jgi:hypothetical protein
LIFSVSFFCLLFKFSESRKNNPRVLDPLFWTSQHICACNLIDKHWELLSREKEEREGGGSKFRLC